MTASRNRARSAVTILLLHALPTYMRLNEAYYNTFSQTAIRFGATLAKRMSIPLPALQFGAFSVDDPASHIELVIRSALRLLDSLGDSVNKLTAPFISSGNAEIDSSQPSSSSSDHNALKMVMKMAHERESRLNLDAGGGTISKLLPSRSTIARMTLVMAKRIDRLMYIKHNVIPNSVAILSYLICAIRLLGGQWRGAQHLSRVPHHNVSPEARTERYDETVPTCCTPVVRDVSITQISPMHLYSQEIAAHSVARETRSMTS